MTPDVPLYVGPMTLSMVDGRSTTRCDIILSQVVMSHRVCNVHRNRHLGMARLHNICNCDGCDNILTYTAMCGGSAWICIAVRSCPWRRPDAISLSAVGRILCTSIRRSGLTPMRCDIAIGNWKTTLYTLSNASMR